MKLKIFLVGSCLYMLIKMRYGISFLWTYVPEGFQQSMKAIFQRATEIILLHPPTTFYQPQDIQHILQVNLKFLF